MGKLLLIGIDGVPYDLILNFSKRGIIPNISKLIEKGKLIKTRAPLPEVSSVSWTSFMTAKNPGEHGIFGFEEIDRNTYQYVFPNFTHIRETFWEALGLRAVVINLPQTYPARKTNGILISGFVAPELERAVYPPGLLPFLKKIGYRVDVDFNLARQDKGAFVKHLIEALKTREKLAKKLWKENWDLFFFVITGTDRLHHFLFDAYQDAEHPHHRDFEKFYRAMDKIAGRFISLALKKKIPVFVLSDHGFCPLKREVYISRYLMKWGYLKFNEDKPEDMTSLAPSSKAFALNPSRIYIHIKGKFSRGSVKPGEYETLIKELTERFYSLRIEGERVIKKVFRKDEIYSGPFMESAPDLVLLSYRGFDLKSGFRKKTLYGASHFTGMHSQDDAFLITYPPMNLPDHPFLYEIGAWSLHLTESAKS